MSENELDVAINLKSLEGSNYDSEVALFDALSNAGVQLCKGYRSGKANRESARKEANRFVEYKRRCEVDPNYTKTRAMTITNVWDTPKPKEDERGKRGRFINCLKPLIVRTAMDYPFHGTRAELFNSWGVYDNYREEQIKAGLFNPNKDHSFNPWKISKDTPPGQAKYCQVIGFKERSSLETALDSLNKEEIIEWNKRIIYVPIIKTTEFINSIDRPKTWKEYIDDCDKRLRLVHELAERENCVLSPELFQTGLYVSRDIYEYWCQFYYVSNGKEIPNAVATEAQKMMYDNYQKYLRQMTAFECSDSEKICSESDIPNKYDIFTDWNYRRKYNELDKIEKAKLLGWEQVRQESGFISISAKYRSSSTL